MLRHPLTLFSQHGIKMSIIFPKKEQPVLLSEEPGHCPSCLSSATQLWYHDITHDEHRGWYYIDCWGCGVGTSYTRSSGAAHDEWVRMWRLATKQRERVDKYRSPG